MYAHRTLNKAVTKSSECFLSLHLSHTASLFNSCISLVHFGFYPYPIFFLYIDIPTSNYCFFLAPHLTLYFCLVHHIPLLSYHLPLYTSFPVSVIFIVSFSHRLILPFSFHITISLIFNLSILLPGTLVSFSLLL